MLDTLIYKRARLFAQMMQCKVLNIRKPVIAYLLITDRCNLRCRYCFVDSKTKKDELTSGEWIELIDELYNQGCRMICLMGGEPLLHPDIEEIITYIHKKKIICDLTTNGALVSQKIDLLKKIDSLMISLDGNEEANDSNRGKGSFQYALNAIKIARNNNILVRINSVLTRQSRDSLKFLLDLADQYDLYVTFSITAEFPIVDINQTREIVLSDKEIKDVYAYLKEVRRKSRRVLFSEYTLDYVINYPLPYNKIILKNDPAYKNFYRQKCLFGRTMFYVDANGDFYPCAALWNTRHFSPLNMRKYGFKKAWDNFKGLPCASCFCPGVPEWNRIMSFKGIADGLGVTFRQALGRRLRHK